MGETLGSTQGSVNRRWLGRPTESSLERMDVGTSEFRRIHPEDSAVGDPGGVAARRTVMRARVFITGATGYIGHRLSAALVDCGHSVTGLIRTGSRKKLPEGCRTVEGSALDASTYGDFVAPCDTMIHLVGVAHPSPAKAAQFRSVDLASTRAAIAVARAASIRHFVYLSVAHPAPVMREYIAARREGERHLADSGLTATVLRPWYVLGPGHFWPIALLPLYGLANLVPAWRASASRLGLVTIGTMVRALVASVESPPDAARTLDVPAIRAFGARRSVGRGGNGERRIA